MKRMIVLIWCFLLAAGSVSVFAQANDMTEPSVKTADTLQIGDYFTLGKYMEEPIVWRYVADDENGKLIVSDKSLCQKPFGFPMNGELGKSDNIWKVSYVRHWLNSDSFESDVDWEQYVSEWEKDYYNLAEKGFLHESNFSLLEKTAMKSVSQWTMLSDYHLDLSENGVSEAYNPIKAVAPAGHANNRPVFYDISELPSVYSGAAYQTADTVFLLDEMQLYHIWENLGDVRAYARVKIDEDKCRVYMLRTPFFQDIYMITDQGEYWRSGEAGYIRPAFYLNEDTAVILSGSGTEDDPYAMSGRAEDDEPANNKPEGITVFYNGSEISFDQSPFIENDRVLVPMRAIFEAFGAEVEWNEEEQSVTATRGTDVIKMRIGDTEITKNESVIESEVAPQVLGYRTFVPLRVIAESLDADVDWIDEEQKVEISK